MSSNEILGLGALAGLTIFLGLPIARYRSEHVGWKVGLSACATGILLFLFWDVLSGAAEPVEEALTAASEHTGSWLRFASLSGLLVGGFALGFLGLVLLDRLVSAVHRRRLARVTAAMDESGARPGAALAAAEVLALLIAIGIGFHNFAEGLAIGQSAAAGSFSFALTLVIGFGLHNATEGFGIVAPLASGARRPSWGFLAVLGTIGGGPTLLGTLIGQAWTSKALSVAFLGLAAGSILFVVIELLDICRALGDRGTVAICIFLGLVLGFSTDFVLVAAGV